MTRLFHTSWTVQPASTVSPANGEYEPSASRSANTTPCAMLIPVGGLESGGGVGTESDGGVGTESGGEHFFAWPGGTLPLWPATAAHSSFRGRGRLLPRPCAC